MKEEPVHQTWQGMNSWEPHPYIVSAPEPSDVCELCHRPKDDPIHAEDGEQANG